MKWVYKIFFLIFLLIAVASAAGSLFFYSRINETYSDADYELRNRPKYHFSLIINDESDVYWENFKKGALKAAADYNVALEINLVADPGINSKTTEYVHIATKSKVDGIIVSGENTDEYKKALKAAAEAGINIVVGVVEGIESDRLFFVGTNNWEFFKNAAMLVQRLDDGITPIDLAVILPSERADGLQDEDNSKQYLTRALASVGINQANRVYRSSELLGAEDQIRAILIEFPSTDVIICTNAKDTVAAAHVIVERNLVGRVKIIGTDLTEEIISYVSKGVIYGVIDRKGYRVGYQSVEALFESIEGTFQSSFRDIKVDVYTQENIGQYGKE